MVQAPIGSATTPELAAAVSNAGGLGSLALSWKSADQCVSMIRATRALTARPFAVNLVLAWPQDQRLELALAEGVSVISLSWGSPAPYVDRIHRAGARVAHSVGSVAEARAAREAGVDVIVAQGREAGGHVLGTAPRDALVEELVAERGQPPVLAAGGITEAQDVRRALAAGAAGVFVGTRFVCATEAGVDPSYQRAILRAGSDDTLLGIVFDKGWENAPHRVLVNSTVRDWIAAGRPGPGARPGERDLVARSVTGEPIERYSDVIPTPGATGDLEALALYAGTGSAAIDDVAPAAELVARLAGGFR